MPLSDREKTTKRPVTENFIEIFTIFLLHEIYRNRHIFGDLDLFLGNGISLGLWPSSPKKIEAANFNIVNSGIKGLQRSGMINGNCISLLILIKILWRPTELAVKILFCQVPNGLIDRGCQTLKNSWFFPDFMVEKNREIFT